MRKLIKHRRGITAIWMIAGLTLTVAIASLMVDYGRVQLAKTELQRTADAAARAGAAGLGNTTLAISLAKQFATANPVNSETFTLLDDDIEIGTWDDVHDTFAPLTGASRDYGNSMKITARRNSTHGGGISLMFGKLFGINTFDIRSTAVACQSPMEWAVVGLDFISMSGNSSTSFWNNGPATNGNGGNIGSNGDITISGTSSIRGNVHWGVGKNLYLTGTIYGAKSPLITPLSYANGSAAPYDMVNNNNGLLPNGWLTAQKNFTGGNGTYPWPAGNYVINSFSLGANGQVTFAGPTTLYCYGSFTLNGRAITSSAVAKNLTVVMIPHPQTGVLPGSVTIGSMNALHAKLYAPQSALIMSGSGAFYGSIVAKSVSMTGGSSINYDASLGRNGGIALVE
jgi:hypothetical protein